MRIGTKLTPEKRKQFLNLLRTNANVTLSAHAVDISRTCAYDHRHDDPEFAAEWDTAIEEAVDLLEAECRRRAFEGCEEPVGWHQGTPGGVVKRYSDTLAIFLLKAHRPEKFRDNLHLSGGLKSEGGELEEVSLAVLRKLDKMIDDEGGKDGEEK